MQSYKVSSKPSIIITQGHGSKKGIWPAWCLLDVLMIYNVKGCLPDMTESFVKQWVSFSKQEQGPWVSKSAWWVCEGHYYLYGVLHNKKTEARRVVD